VEYSSILIKVISLRILPPSKCVTRPRGDNQKVGLSQQQKWVGFYGQECPPKNVPNSTLEKHLKVYERIPWKIHFECDFPSRIKGIEASSATSDAWCALLTAEGRAMAAMKNTHFFSVFCRSLDAQTLSQASYKYLGLMALFDSSSQLTQLLSIFDCLPPTRGSTFWRRINRRVTCPYP